ncbi:MAG: hypothetical protein WBQ10_21610 [Terriglobales bacterium]
MKSVLWLVLLFPAMLLAQSVFDGTWVAKLDTAKLPKRPEVYLLQNGIYECSSCVPKLKINADGKDYPIAGSPYFSTVSIRVIDDNNIQLTEKQGDKIVYSETDAGSPNGETLLQNVTDSAAPTGQPVTAEESYMRISPGPVGSNLISGSWQAQKIDITSDNGVTVTYRSTAHGLQASNPGGEGYDAKFDGNEYLIHGDPVHSTVSLKQINAHTIVETDKQDGAVHYRLVMAVSPDGKWMKVTETDGERNQDDLHDGEEVAMKIAGSSALSLRTGTCAAQIRYAHVRHLHIYVLLDTGST